MSSTRRLENFPGEQLIADICGLDWLNANPEDMTSVAWAYYYFSVQFRENLEIACELFPDDLNLRRLKLEECNTSNLSPFPGVAAAGEKLDHDEFMRRTLLLSPVPETVGDKFAYLGNKYLKEMRRLDPMLRAMSIVSYEDGGLESVFRAMLTSPAYDTALLNAFRFFMAEHIRFDSDPLQGHGALSRHIGIDDRVDVVWTAFRQLFIDFAPGLLKRSFSPDERKILPFKKPAT